jgi:hypothetical protein
VSDGNSIGAGAGGVGRWTLTRGVSCSVLRGGPRFDLWSIGGGERNLGETGHLGDSRRCSIVVGDLTGAPTLEVGSETDGSSVGVWVEDSVLDAGGGAELLGFESLEGLRSC